MPDVPYGGFRFVVEVDGTQAGGFSQVGGLERATETEDYGEGGVNDFVHKLVTVTKYPNLVLKRGIADRVDLFDWHQDVIDGEVEPKTVSVIVNDERGNEAWRWIFSNAYPVKWNGSDLDATSSAVMVESVELTHHGMRRQ